MRNLTTQKFRHLLHAISEEEKNEQNYVHRYISVVVFIAETRDQVFSSAPKQTAEAARVTR
jgi:hypothetical protein